MKSFLFVAALAIPASAQQLTVLPLDNPPDCTYPIASGNQAGVVTMCHDASDIAVIVVSLSALPSPAPLPGFGSLRCDPSTLVLVDVMQVWQQPMGPWHWRWTIDLLPAWAPVQFVAQPVFVGPAYLWTVPESYQFSWV